MWVGVTIHRQDVCSQDYSLLRHLYWSCYILRAFKFCGSNVVIIRPPQLRLLIAGTLLHVFLWNNHLALCPPLCILLSCSHKQIGSMVQKKHTFFIALPWENLILQLIYACPAISLWSGVENRGKGRTEKLLSFFFSFFYFLKVVH